MLSGYARNEWITIITVSLLLTVVLFVVGLAWLIPVLWLFALVLLAFFRDPDRTPPTQRGVVVAPADGRIASVHEIESFEPFEGEGATCIRIFMGLSNVHVNRAPCHGLVTRIEHKPGKHISALNPGSLEENEANLIVLHHPIRRYPVAAVRQIAGQVARTIFCAVDREQTVQRGQRIGMIKLGSTTELYLPAALRPDVKVQRGQKVRAGETVVADVVAIENQAAAEKLGVPTPDQRAQRQSSAEGGVHDQTGVSALADTTPTNDSDEK